MTQRWQEYAKCIVESPGLTVGKMYEVHVDLAGNVGFENDLGVNDVKGSHYFEIQDQAFSDLKALFNTFSEEEALQDFVKFYKYIQAQTKKLIAESLAAIEEAKTHVETEIPT